MNRKSGTEIKVVRIDETPILFAITAKLKIAKIFDDLVAQHANWMGELSGGQVISGWLVYVLSTSDHRLNQVEDWVERRQRVFEINLGRRVRGLDFSDDRLAMLLDKLSEAEVWSRFETRLNQQIMRVYELESDMVRLDSTTISTYTAVSPEGLLQLGRSKDGRPEDAQLKIQLAMLDPLGMPLATQVIAGNCADDRLYVPAIKQVQASIGAGGKTYVGDVKMAALETRARLAHSHDYYLCPLGERQLSEAQRAVLIAAAVHGKVKLMPIKRERRSLLTYELLMNEQIATGYTINVSLHADVDDVHIDWKERRLIVRSLAYAKAEARQLDKRLDRAETQLRDLTIRRQGKRRLDIEQARAAATQIIADCRVEGLLSAMIDTSTTTHDIRPYNAAPARRLTQTHLSIQIKRNQHRIVMVKERMGWRVYATNHPKLSLPQAVLAYREQYRIEDGISRLKGRPLGLSPMFLQSESRMIGLIHLLTIALRLLTIIEFPVRRQLAAKKKTLAGIYPGQKGRRTSRPSTELMLTAFQGIDLVLGSVKGNPISYLTPLSATQLQILDLLGLNSRLYDQLLSNDQF